MPVTFDYANRWIVPSGPILSGLISLDVQRDLYSFGKEQWLADPDLHKFRFPITAIGGQEVSAGLLGTTYLLTDGWRINPDIATSYSLQIVGNIFTDTGLSVALPVAMVNVQQVVSTLVEVRSLYEAALEDLRKLMMNRFETDPVSGKLTVYEDDDTTVAFETDGYEDVAGTQPYRGRQMERRDRFE